MAKIGIFRSGFWAAGGVETWIYNIARRWGKTHDITIIYDNADPKQIDRLRELVKCVEYVGQDFEFDTAIWCYDFLGFNNTKAKRKIHVVHADYSHTYNFDKGASKLPFVDEVYAVSAIAAKSAAKLFNVKVDVLYNPMEFAVEKKPLRIVSPTRLTHEKGLERMIKLDKALQKSGIDYIWDIYTPSYDEDKITARFSSNVTFLKPIMSMMNKMKQYDFVVQMSDTESFGYTIVEAMALKLQLVVTAIPVLPELNVNKHNAIVVPLRKHFVNYDKIVEKMIAKSPYLPPESDYKRLLGKPSRSNYNPTIVKNIAPFDIMLPDGRWLEPKKKTVIDNYNESIKGIKVIK